MWPMPAWLEFQMNKAKYMQLLGGVEFIDGIPKSPCGELLQRVLCDRAKQVRATHPQVPAKT